MIDIERLASDLFGRRRSETQSVVTDATTRTYIGTATCDSENGTVKVDLGGDVTMPEDLTDPDGNTYTEHAYEGVEMPCAPNVRKGDQVLVTLVGGSTLKSPTVSGCPGSGDRQQEQIDAAAAVANATAQHFWADSNGAHVSTEAGKADGNKNALWNSLGMLFRQGTDNLLALVTGTNPGMLIYDGGGNEDSNIIASFVGDLIELGKNSTSAVIEFCGGMGKILYEAVSESSGTLKLVTKNSRIWMNLRELGKGGLFDIGVGNDYLNSATYINISATEQTNFMHILTGRLSAELENSTHGPLMPVGVFTVTMTTPPNNGADATISFSGLNYEFGVFDTDYVVILTPEGQPNGFTHISYVVSAKYITGFRIHSYNDWSESITQTINAIVIHR